jgi:hypothetical protein
MDLLLVRIFQFCDVLVCFSFMVHQSSWSHDRSMISHVTSQEASRIASNSDNVYCTEYLVESYPFGDDYWTSSVILAMRERLCPFSLFLICASSRCISLVLTCF